MEELYLRYKRLRWEEVKRPHYVIILPLQRREHATLVPPFVHNGLPKTYEWVKITEEKIRVGNMGIKHSGVSVEQKHQKTLPCLT